MKTRFKKILAAAMSAAMLLSSFSAFAADDVSMPLDGADTYLNPDTDISLELPDEESTEGTDDIFLPEESLAPDNTSQEKTEEAPFTDMLMSTYGINTYATTVVDSGKCGINLTWELDSDGTLTISGTGGMTDYTDSITAPWYQYKDVMTRLLLENGITSIGSQAFYRCNFTGDLIIPDNVFKIGGRSFAECSQFTGAVSIPASTAIIGAQAFLHCGVSSITVDINNPNYSSYDGVLYNKDQTIAKECGSGKTGELNIASTVISIGTCAFYGCGGLTGNLVIPDSVTSIGTQAFMGCSGLTGNLAISDSVTSIGTQTFMGCSGLTGNLAISDSVTSIGTNAFWGCSSLTDMYIPKPEDSLETGNFPNRVHWKYDLSKCTASISDQICTGEAIVPDESNITVTSPNGKTLYYGSDYVIESARNNIVVGTATAHIAPPTGGISILSQDVPFNIVGIDLSGATVTFPEDITWQGEPCCPETTVVLDGKTLERNVDYTVEYSDNNAVGIGKAKITGIGNYIGSINAEFEIKSFKPGGREKVDISKNIVEATISGTFVFNGTAHTPKPKLVYHFVNPTTGITIDYDMVEGTDYEIISYTNNVNAGTAIITIEGIGTFERKKIVSFNILPCELSAITIADISNYEYCKKDICPDPEVKIGDVILTKDVDYTLEYENNRNRGTASVIIKGKGNLSGTATKNFEITPRDGTKFTIIIWL